MGLVAPLAADVVEAASAAPWLSPALAAIGAVLGLVLDMLGSRRSAIVIVRVGLAFATAHAAAIAFDGMSRASSERLVVMAERFLAGGGFAGLAGVVYLLGLIATGAGIPGVDASRRGGVAALIALAAVACHALMSTVDIVVMFIALEAVAIATYGLAVVGGTDRGDEAVMRYVVQGAIVAGLAAFGLAVLVGWAGSASGYGELRDVIAGRPAGAVLLPLVLLVSALAFKAGAFPFHAWVPDVYETAPAGTVTFLASAPKVGAVAAAVLFTKVAFGAADPVGSQVLAVIAAASIIFGNLGALPQTDVRRMLGYSAIAQAGYAFVGVASGAPVGVFVSAYAIGVAVSFGVIASVPSVLHHWNGAIDGLRGLASRSRTLAVALAVALLSLTGIPLTFGFIGKLLVFGSAIRSGLLWLAVVGVLGSVVSFGYYGRVILALFQPAEDDEACEDASRRVAPRAWGLAVLAAAVVVLGVAPVVFGLDEILAVFGV